MFAQIFRKYFGGKIQKRNQQQSFTTRLMMLSFFSATKIVYGPSTKGLNPLRSKYGTQLLKDFQELLNRESHVNDDFFNQIPQKPIQDHLGDVPSLEEVEKATNQLKNNKATRSDGAPTELFKVGGPALTDHTHRLIAKI